MPYDFMYIIYIYTNKLVFGSSIHKVAGKAPGIVYPQLRGFIPHGLFYSFPLKHSASLVHVLHTRTWEHTSTCSGKYLLSEARRLAEKSPREGIGKLGSSPGSAANEFCVCLWPHLFIFLGLNPSSVKQRV